MIPRGTVRFIEDSSGLRRRLVWDGGGWLSKPVADLERERRRRSGEPEADPSLSTRDALRRDVTREILRRYGHHGIRPIFNETGPWKRLLSHTAMRDHARSLGFDWCSRCWHDGLKGHLTMPGEQTPGNTMCRKAQTEANRRKQPR